MRNRIEFERKQAGLSRTQTGRMIGVSGLRIALWEKGVFSPGAIRTTALARLFRCNYSWLTGDSEERN